MIGSSYGAYLAVLATARRRVRWLGLRVPALYRDDNWHMPRFELDREDLVQYRRSLVSYESNLALTRCRDFDGVLIVESENDEIVPHPAVASYLSSFVCARSVTYRVIDGADHALSEPDMRRSYDHLLTQWLHECCLAQGRLPQKKYPGTDRRLRHLHSMPSHKPTDAPPLLGPEGTAFFLDLDGTLSELVSDPRKASVSPALIDVLDQLSRASDGALAAVSGRSIAQLDEMLAPLRLPLVGVHGIERRESDGTVTRFPINADLLGKIVAVVSAFTSSHPGTLAEVKPGSVALHYRKRPDLEKACHALAQSLAENDSRIRLLPGKMVIEMTLASLNKGDAIAGFMRTPPFAGRIPFFVGDDVTDETGFAVVNALGGVTVKVGQGETSARYWLEDVASVAAYLQTLLPPHASELNGDNPGLNLASSFTRETS